MLGKHTTLTTGKRFIQWIALSTLRTTRAWIVRYHNKITSSSLESLPNTAGFFITGLIATFLLGMISPYLYKVCKISVTNIECKDISLLQSKDLKKECPLIKQKVQLDGVKQFECLVLVSRF